MKSLLTKLFSIVIAAAPAMSVISCGEEVEKPITIDKDEDPGILHNDDTTVISFVYDGEDYGTFDYDKKWNAENIDVDKFDQYITAIEEFYEEIPKRITTEYIDLEISQFIGSPANEIDFHYKHIPVDRLILKAFDYFRNPFLTDLNGFWSEHHIDLAYDKENFNGLYDALDKAGATKFYSDNVYAVFDFIHSAKDFYNRDIDEVFREINFNVGAPNEWVTETRSQYGPFFKLNFDGSESNKPIFSSEMAKMFNTTIEDVTKLMDEMKEKLPIHNGFSVVGYRDTGAIVISINFEDAGILSSFLKENSPTRTPRHGQPIITDVL